MRVDLTGPAKKKIEVLGDEMGMTQVVMMSKLVEWFAKQSGPVRNAIVGDVSKVDRHEVTQMILKKMVQGD